MYREIQAKTLLSTIQGDDPVFGLKYNLNLYRGCEHQCIYCDSRSECYGIENFHDVLVKVNAIELLEKELARKRIKGTVGFGSMSDPYTRAELTYGLTHKALEVLARRGFPAHLITKSDLILRDIDLIAAVNRVHCSVCFTLTTTDDALAREVEPGAPLPSARLSAMRRLAERGIPAGPRADLDGARDGAREGLERLARSAREVDASLPQLVESARAKVDYQFQRLQEGLSGKVRHRLERAHPEWPRLRHYLLPGDRLQERRLASLEVVAYRGAAVADDLCGWAAAHARALAGGVNEHLIVEL